MMCPACRANLGRITARGEPMIRNKGLILKADGIVALCPKCGADVPFTAEITRALNRGAPWLLPRGPGA